MFRKLVYNKGINDEIIYKLISLSLSHSLSDTSL